MKYIGAHVSAADYELRSTEACAAMLDKPDAVVGMKYLRGMPLNDAKSAFANRVDRYHSLGQGNIGLTAFATLMRDARLDGIPMIPGSADPSLWPKEIHWLRAQQFSDKTAPAAH